MKVDIVPNDKKIMYYFWPTVTFNSPDFGCDYVKGLRYQVREGNAKLEALVNRWEGEGLVSLSAPETPIIAPSVEKKGFFKGLFS